VEHVANGKKSPESLPISSWINSFHIRVLQTAVCRLIFSGTDTAQIKGYKYAKREEFFCYSYCLWIGKLEDKNRHMIFELQLGW